MPTTSSPRVSPRPGRGLVVFPGARLAAVAVLLVGAGVLGAVPAAAHWRASGTGSTTAAVGFLPPPTNVSVPASSDPDVRVSWMQPEGAVVPAGYYVTRITGTTATAACGSGPSALITAAACTDASVPEGTHRYQVTAVHRSWTAASPVSGSVQVVSLKTLVFASQPAASITAGSTIPPLSVQARTAVGLMPLAGVQVAIAIGQNPAGGVLSGTVTATTDLWGNATFAGLRIDKAGSGYTLAASSPNFAGAVSGAFTVVPAAASALVASGPALAGAASSDALLGPVTVQRQDAYGNAVTAGSTAITLSTSSAAGFFAATAGGARITTLAIPAGSSTAAFFYGDTRAGTPAITLAAAGITPSPAITASISAAAASRLKFDALAATYPRNTNFTPAVKVHIQDAFGNATASTAAVSITSNCSIRGTLTVTATAGTASFSDLQITRKASSCTLTASSGTLAGDTSTPFSVE